MAEKSSTTKETNPPSTEQETPSPPSETSQATPPVAEHAPVHGTVVAGKRYDFRRARSNADQEEYQGIPIRQSYEDVRDDLSHKEARALWRDGDRRKAYMRESMQRIHDDETLTDEGKQQEAQRLIESNTPHILKGYEDARAKLESSAESSWKFSIPCRTIRPWQPQAYRIRLNCSPCSMRLTLSPRESKVRACRQSRGRKTHVAKAYGRPATIT